MSNYQYRKADQGLYGPVKLDKPHLPITFNPEGEAGLMNRYDRELMAYESHLASLPRVASVPSSNWKDGEIVEVGKDFKFGCEYNSSIGWKPIDIGFYDQNDKYKRLIAVPISGGEVKEEEPIWKEEEPSERFNDLPFETRKRLLGNNEPAKEEETIDSLNKAQPVPTGERMFTAEQMKEIAWEAWKSAANAYKMYPNNKHSFSDVWDYLEGKYLTNKQK